MKILDKPCCEITIEGKKVLISAIDLNKISNDTKLKDLDKLIFGISKLKGTGLKLYHKNNNAYDFRRSNLILTNEKFVKELMNLDAYNAKLQHYLFNPLGVHLDPYKKEYEIIYFDLKDNLIVHNEILIAEAIKIFNKFKNRYK